MRYDYLFDPAFPFPKGGIRYTPPTDKDGNICSIANFFLNQLQQMFNLKNLPKTVPQYILKTLLHRNGYAGIARVNGDLYAMAANFGGEPDGNYMPKTLIFDNPYLNFRAELEIGKDCVLFKNDYALMGMMPIINRYATLLAENELSMYMSDIATRLISIITTADDDGKEAAELYFKDLIDGKFTALPTEDFFKSMNVQPYFGAAGSSLIGQQIELQQYLLASYYNRIGLDANYNMKRESLSITESQMNFDALFPFIDTLEACMKEGCDDVNRVFGENWSYEKGSSWARNEKEQDAIIDNLEKQDETEVKNEDVENKEEVKSDEAD